MSPRGDILDRLASIEGAVAESGVSMVGLTTWRVGGPAGVLATALTVEAALGILRAVRESGAGLCVIGNGSNVLVSDTGVEGVVLRLSGELAEFGFEGESVRAGAGAGLVSISKAAAAAGLSGIEFASGIPGTVGGAVMTNAGAFSACLADTLSEVVAAGRNGELERRDRFEAGYREPLLPGDRIVLGARLSLREGRAEEVEATMARLAQARRIAQPQGMPTAGSVFKNPPGESAGILIDRCGLRGARVGGARITEAHANFIVNTGGATASDILALIDLARREVLARFGISLELEVRLVGFEED